ncbi:MAG: hypothetical protein HOE11_00945 [Candidatus Diapherotrites archaeon]|jgi:hypothetical protein|nr:hypothetical protein [Candidatus Diapherotrites archaeon]MBT4596544.1 hypothetical protein [Candidatus Diapherotrites archaeon]
MGDKKGRKGKNGNATAYNAKLKRDAAEINRVLSGGRVTKTPVGSTPTRKKTRRRHGRH